MSSLVLFKTEVDNDTYAKLKDKGAIEITDTAFIIGGNSLIFFIENGLPENMIIIDLKAPGAIWGMDNDLQSKVKEILESAFCEHADRHVATALRLTKSQ
jgi:hypothetical protein